MIPRPPGVGREFLKQLGATDWCVHNGRPVVLPCYDPGQQLLGCWVARLEYWSMQFPVVPAVAAILVQNLVRRECELIDRGEIA